MNRGAKARRRARERRIALTETPLASDSERVINDYSPVNTRARY
jgi:hypothetical protein